VPDEEEEQSRETLKRDFGGSETASEDGDEERFGGSVTASEEEDQVVEQKEPPKQIATGSRGLGGLNRPQMEQERLERAKRAGIKQDLIEPPAKRAKVDHVPVSQTSGNTSLILLT
jgi:hypothetical protein